MDNNDGGVPWATNSNWGWFKLPNLVQEVVRRLTENPEENSNTVMPWSQEEIGNLAHDSSVQEELLCRGMRLTDQDEKIYDLSPREDDEPRVFDVVKGQNWLRIVIISEVNVHRQRDSDGSDQEKEISDSEGDFLVLDGIESGDLEMENPGKLTVALNSILRCKHGKNRQVLKQVAVQS